MLKASLEWINRHVYTHFELNHPNDENKVKCALRALDKIGVTINTEEIADYCRLLGIAVRYACG